MDNNRIILPIPPQTNIRSTQGDDILFRIPEVCRKLKGKKPCAYYRRNSVNGTFQEFTNKKTGRVSTGLCPHTLTKGGRYRKKLLDRYNKYKVDIRELAHQNGFKLYPCGWSLYFYIPLPKRSNKFPHGGRSAMHGQLHLQKPDIDNMAKAFFDSLWITDEMVAQLSGIGKFWIDQGQVSPELQNGYIEILLNQAIYNPFNVEFIDQARLKRMMEKKPKRKYVESGKYKKGFMGIIPAIIKQGGSVNYPPMITKEGLNELFK